MLGAANEEGSKLFLYLSEIPGWLQAITFRELGIDEGLVEETAAGRQAGIADREFVETISPSTSPPPPSPRLPPSGRPRWRSISGERRAPSVLSICYISLAHLGRRV
jgi:hypothetical protein